jgi:hypothetical protein
VGRVEVGDVDARSGEDAVQPFRPLPGVTRRRIDPAACLYPWLDLLLVSMQEEEDRIVGRRDLEGVTSEVDNGVPGCPGEIFAERHPAAVVNDPLRAVGGAQDSRPTIEQEFWAWVVLAAKGIANVCEFGPLEEDGLRDERRVRQTLGERRRQGRLPDRSAASKHHDTRAHGADPSVDDRVGSLTSQQSQGAPCGRQVDRPRFSVAALLEHRKACDMHLGLVLPGGNAGPYTAPLLIPSLALEEVGARVEVVEYPDFRPSGLGPEEAKAFNDVVFQRVVEKVEARRWDVITFVAKSLGTLFLSTMGPLPTHAAIRAIWVTPLLGFEYVRSGILEKGWPSLLVAGAADPYHDAQAHDEVRRELDAASLVVEGADHGLVVDGDVRSTVGGYAALADASLQFLGT